MVRRHIKRRHRYGDGGSIEEAWRRVPIEQPFQHAVFRFGIALWKAIVIGVCFAMVVGGLWLLLALAKAMAA
jgi:hypothetical protein